MPVAPTRMPPMIITGSWKSRPANKVATPVKAFSNEISTGMSAPPIGNVRNTPYANAAMAMPSNSAGYADASTGMAR